MRNETLGGVKMSLSESFKIKEKLFSLNSNVTSNEVSSMIEKDEEDIEDIEELEDNLKTSSINTNPKEHSKKMIDKEQSHFDSEFSSDSKVQMYSKLEIQQKISIIFKNYSIYSKEENKFFMLQQTLIRLLKRLNLFDANTININELDILLRNKKSKSSSNKLDEKQLSNFIIRLTEKIHPEEFRKDPKSSVCLFFKETFEMLLKEIDRVQENEIKNSSETPKLLTYKFIESIIAIPISQESIEIIISVYQAIKEIYIKYFTFELSGKKDLKKLNGESLSSLNEFCKDFEIVPYILNFNQLAIYYKFMTEYENSKNYNAFELKTDLGNNFTLSKFFLFFIHFSKIANNKIHKMNFDKSPVSDVDGLLQFLEKLENSKGFRNFERKLSRPHSGALFLIPTNYLLHKLENNEKKNNSRINMDNSFGEEKNINQQSILKVSDRLVSMINSRLDEVKKVFIHYCHTGNIMNDNSMNFTSFAKFLRECKVIAELPDRIKKVDKKNTKFLIFNRSSTNQASSNKDDKNYVNKLTMIINTDSIIGKLSDSDINIIFCKITGNSYFEINPDKKSFAKSGLSSSFEENVIKGYEAEKTKNYHKQSSKLINLNMFIKSFELIAMRLFPKLDMDSAILKFFEEYLDGFIKTFQNRSGNTTIFHSGLDILNNNEIRNFMNELKPIFLRIFNGYLDQTNLMNFSMFHDFYKDFNLFPDLINLSQLKSLFLLLSSKIKMSEHSNNKSYDLREISKINLRSKPSRDVINFSLFQESILMTLGYINFDFDINVENKFLYLLERMNKSKGLDKLQKKSGNTFTQSKDFNLFFSQFKDRNKESSNYKIHMESSLQNSNVFSYIFD